MAKDPLTKIQNTVLKADKLFRARAFKKAGKLFYKAADNYIKLDNYEMAIRCYMRASECYIETEKPSDALKLIRLAGDTFLKLEKFKEANQIYKDAVDLIPKLRSVDERNQSYILYSVLTYLCFSLEIRHESGLNFIKKFQKKVDPVYFRENELIQMVSDLTVAIRNKNQKNIDNIIRNIDHFKLLDAEADLLKIVLLLAKIKIKIQSELYLDKKIYTTNDLINLKLNLDYKIFSEISNDANFQYKIRKIDIVDINPKLSDNIAVSKKPPLPIEISNKKASDTLDFRLKPHFQIDQSYIGPIIITFRINDLFLIEYSTDQMKLKLISPPPTLNVSINNLRPPLIGQSFPFEILVENESDGEAIEVDVKVEFPDELKVMRGTTEKQIYSLRSKESIKWELSLKPIEVGDYLIKFIIKFKDSDNNPIQLEPEFPFSVTM